jgi:hypothetical protein
MVCEYCNFIAKNQQALSAHYRGCSAKKDVDKKNDGEPPNETIVVQTSVPETSTPKISKVKKVKQ